MHWRRKWQPTPVFLPGKSHGRRGLVGCSPWGREESDTTEQLHFIFSLSCIGEGNGNPLQCSCLENPRDGGAWWLPSPGSHRVGHDRSDLAAAVAVAAGDLCNLGSNPYLLHWQAASSSLSQQESPPNHQWSRIFFGCEEEMLLLHLQVSVFCLSYKLSFLLRKSPPM